MQYWGKLLGFAVASVLGVGVWGMAAGVLVGHLADVVISKEKKKRSSFISGQQKRQTLFFRTTFEVMGHLAKSKGRVTEMDISVATLFMEQMQLHGRSRLNAQQAFRDGKAPEYPLRQKLRELKRVCFGRTDLIRMFIEIQLQVAFADNDLHPRERFVLYIIADELGVSRQEFERFLRMREGERHFNNTYRQQRYQQQRPSSTGPTLQDACNVLGVKVQDDAAIIKRAYRKLMSEHHPDKLVAKGLPPEMLEMAKRKAQDIQAAYDLVKKEKGIR